MNDSWDSFAGALQEEADALGRVEDAALRLTQSLVNNDIGSITLTERELDGARRAYITASGKRRGMQVRGFGTMTLRQVCAYAPRRLSPSLNQRLSELATRSIGLGITNNNNKALIAAGLQRLFKVTAALQQAASDQPKTYKRRGFIPPPTNSVLVSSQA